MRYLLASLLLLSAGSASAQTALLLNIDQCIDNLRRQNIARNSRNQAACVEKAGSPDHVAALCEFRTKDPDGYRTEVLRNTFRVGVDEIHAAIDAGCDSAAAMKAFEAEVEAKKKELDELKHAADKSLQDAGKAYDFSRGASEALADRAKLRVKYTTEKVKEAKALKRLAETKKPGSSVDYDQDEWDKADAGLKKAARTHSKAEKVERGVKEFHQTTKDHYSNRLDALEGCLYGRYDDSAAEVSAAKDPLKASIALDSAIHDVQNTMHALDLLATRLEKRTQKVRRVAEIAKLKIDEGKVEAAAEKSRQERQGDGSTTMVITKGEERYALCEPVFAGKGLPGEALDGDLPAEGGDD